MVEERAVSVAVDDGLVAGMLGLPAHPRGLIVVAETGSRQFLEKHRALVPRRECAGE